MATMTAASTEQQRAALEAMRERHAALIREVRRYGSQALAAGETPDPAQVRNARIDALVLAEWIADNEPRIAKAERHEAQASAWKDEQRQRERLDAHERAEKEARAAAVAWLEKTLTAAAVHGIRKADALARAKADGIDTAALQHALDELAVQEIDGEFLHGSRSPERGVIYWQGGSPRPHITRPAKV
jgi:hypothetical protein